MGDTGAIKGKDMENGSRKKNGLARGELFEAYLHHRHDPIMELVRDGCLVGG
jgi:hypothetical protein